MGDKPYQFYHIFEYYREMRARVMLFAPSPIDLFRVCIAYHAVSNPTHIPSRVPLHLARIEQFHQSRSHPSTEQG